MSEPANDIVRLPAVELRDRVLSGELSPVEVVEAALRQVERHNGRLNAVVTLNESALDDAREVERRLTVGRRRGAPGVDDDVVLAGLAGTEGDGRHAGLLCGLPVGIKDVTPVAGLRTTYGSPLYADHVPERDALVVERLRRAGGVILGKTNTPEFATGGNTFNEVFGRTRNPWNPERSAGGSTGGGAVGLATGMIAVAEGTDLGGSLRIPASFCGVVGLRPSPGLVPTLPSDYLWDTMQVTGPMGRTAEDVALALQAMAGPSPRAPLAQPIEGRDFLAAVRAGPRRGVRLAYCPDVAGIGVDADVERVCRAAALELEQAGAEVEEIELDLSFAWEPFLAIRGHWMVAQQHGRLDRLEELGDNLRGNVEAGLATSMRELGHAEQERGRIWQVFQNLFGDFDHLLTPCMAVPPFPVEDNYPETIGGRDMETYIDWVAPTFILSLTGLPVASVPAGLDGGGLPVGLQIVGRPRNEESVLALAAALQRARPIGLPDLP